MKRLILVMALTCLALAAMGAKQKAQKPVHGRIVLESYVTDDATMIGTLYGGNLYRFDAVNLKDDSKYDQIRSAYEGKLVLKPGKTKNRSVMRGLHFKPEKITQKAHVVGVNVDTRDIEHQSGTVILENVPGKDGFPNWVEVKKATPQIGTLNARDTSPYSGSWGTKDYAEKIMKSKPGFKHFRLIVQSMTQAKPLLLINMDGSTQIDLPPLYDSLTIRRTKAKMPSAKLVKGDVFIEVPEKLLDMRSRKPNDFGYLNTLVDYNVLLDDQPAPIGGSQTIGW
jgi:hypothetical protein